MTDAEIEARVEQLKETIGIQRASWFAEACRLSPYAPIQVYEWAARYVAIATAMDECVKQSQIAVFSCPKCGRQSIGDKCRNGPCIMDARQGRVFTHCNVCGFALRTDDEDKMGTCERCARE